MPAPSWYCLRPRSPSLTPPNPNAIARRYLSFQQLLQMNPEVVQHLAIDFSLPPPKPGMDFIELKPGGSNLVTGTVRLTLAGKG